MNNAKYLDIFNKYRIYNARMISYSKTRYLENNRFNLVIFNSKICIKNNNSYEVVLYGDVDISLEGDIFKQISNELNLVLYFFNESSELLEENVKWNTNMETPFISEEERKKRKRKEKKDILKNIKNNNLEYLNKKNISNGLSKTSPKDFFEKYFNRTLKNLLEIKIEKNEINNFYLSSINDKKIKNNFFANVFLDFLLSKHFKKSNINEVFKDYNISNFWISEETNDFLNYYNELYEKHYQKKEKRKKTNHLELNYSSYLALIPYFASNKLNYSNKSLKKNVIYFLIFS